MVNYDSPAIPLQYRFHGGLYNGAAFSNQETTDLAGAATKDAGNLERYPTPRQTL
ncbi:MAG: hypothetical protein IPG44_13625 [Anaerolineales bacterium]|nr:hypothetical protein [Anaerolineales bacterium]